MMIVAIIVGEKCVAGGPYFAYIPFNKNAVNEVSCHTTSKELSQRSYYLPRASWKTGTHVIV